jgi:DNA-3-methyladenine glycosylase II
VADYGVQKGFAKTFGRRKLPTPKQFLKIGEKWRPYRSVAAWYFWRARCAGGESLRLKSQGVGGLKPPLCSKIDLPKPVP